MAPEADLWPREGTKTRACTQATPQVRIWIEFGLLEPGIFPMAVYENHHSGEMHQLAFYSCDKRYDLK